ncbi:MAG: outer membrane protein transport protein [Thiobacillus sp.]|nr:outer membrane protein transport protein [Thiobacillus sp.]MDP1925524.1 outer membrane protein transport protein [Thiobacillus sp.]MDP3124409.1 outer membrane protein transport protein [Thiobacillus sp.]
MKLTRVFAFMALAGLAGSAFATNGMFSHGYGMKSKGMAGASTASSDDAFFGANNPAAAAFAGNRLDLGVDLFSPRRDTSHSTFGAVDSEANYFLIPEFGYNRMLGENVALGVTVYGQGGMNTDYPAFANGFNSLGGSGALGVDLMQLIIAPTAAFKVAPNHSIGVSPLLGYQKFAATGLQGFAGISSDGTALTNKGNDDAFGYGLRIGYMGKIGAVTIGAAYSTKVDFQEFDKYKGLFAEQGDLDLPENYNLGVAWDVTPAIKLAADYQRINYSGVNAIGNPSANYAIGGLLGMDNGSGFGWADMDVWKLGVEYKLSQQMTLRAGYSYGDSPIDGKDPAEATFNIIAPGVIEHHLTLGMTYTTASGDEMTVAYMHGFENEVKGDRPAGFGGGVDTTTMYQNSLGFQYSWKM